MGKKTSFVPSGSDCGLGKQSKPRVTVAPFDSVIGKNLKPLVTGNSKKNKTLF